MKKQEQRIRYEVQEWSTGWSVLAKDRDGEIVWESESNLTERQALDLMYQKQGVDR